jgi:diaminopimelate dehydrogenase
MRPRRLAVVGWGRLGRACAAALHDAADLALAGVVRRAQRLGEPGGPPRGVACVAHVSELGAIDAALLCVPSEAATGAARELLQARMPLVECARFDGEALRRHHDEIVHLAQRHRVAAVVGAGWDPGLLAQLRSLFELLIPRGDTRVTRHVAVGMHHAPAAETLPGVRGALCSELHDPAGRRQRYVYVELARGTDFDLVRRRIESDPLYADEPTQVLPVDDIAGLQRCDHGVLIERLGKESGTAHDSLTLEARLDENAFSAQLMLDAARKMAPGSRGVLRYTPFGLVPLEAGSGCGSTR